MLSSSRLLALGFSLLFSNHVMAADVMPNSASSAQSSTPSATETEAEVDLMYQLMMSEIAAQRGDSPSAVQNYADAARRIREPRLAKRALEFALSAGDIPLAFEQAQLWLELDPLSSEAKQALVALSAAVGNEEVLLPLLKQRIKTAQEPSDAINLTLRILSRLPDRARAIALMEDVLAENKDLPEAHIALARLAFDSGNYVRAEQELDLALRQRPDWELAALMRLEAGLRVDVAQAIRIMQTFIKSYPKALDAQVGLARALAQQRDFDGAKQLLKEVLGVRPDFPEALLTLGLVQYQSNQPVQARLNLKKYVDQQLLLSQLNSQAANAGAVPSGTNDLTVALLLLTQIAEDAKQYQEAIDWLELVENPDQRFAVQLRRAQLIAKLGRLDDARSAFSVIEAKNETQRAQIDMAQAQMLRDLGRVAEAFDLLSATLSLQPTNPELLYDYALLAEQLKNFPEMEQALRKVMQLKPDNAHAYNALAYSFADRNERLPEARALLEKALLLMPNDPFILDSMGWLNYREGNIKDALEILQRAYGLRPDTEIGVHLGELLWVSGDKRAARRVWREVKDKAPENALLQSTLKRFDLSTDL